MTDWKNEIKSLVQRMGDGESLQSIGDSYGVSKQRMYQVLTKFGIETPQRSRSNFLRGREPKYYWLNRMLAFKGFDSKDRLYLLKHLPLPDHCPVLGIRMNYEGFDTHIDNSPSIDRIDNSRGYEVDNIQIMSRRANRLKSDSNAEELQKVVDYIKSLRS